MSLFSKTEGCWECSSLVESLRERLEEANKLIEKYKEALEDININYTIVPKLKVDEAADERIEEFMRSQDKNK